MLARKLLAEGHPDSELIRSRQEALNESWADLRTLANHREERLAGAHEIQRFNRCALYNIINYIPPKTRCQFIPSPYKAEMPIYAKTRHFVCPFPLTMYM